jgi:hypothetical protein
MGIHAQRDFVSASYLSISSAAETYIPFSASPSLVGSSITISDSPPISPKIGSTWIDTANLDLTGSENVTPTDVITNTSRWASYGFGYTMGATFSAVTGAMRITWTTPVGGTTQFAGVSSSVTLVPGENYLFVARVNNEVGNTDICLTVGYKSSGEWLTHDGTDFTMMVAFIADGTSAVFGIETIGVSGKYTDVKSLNVYKVNQKGYPTYIWNGTSWEAVTAVSAKLDILSRVNTFGTQSIGGLKTFTTGIVTTSPTASGSYGVRNITVSTASATGGSDGDVWLVYV